jgi:hypothetical protein
MPALASRQSYQSCLNHPTLRESALPSLHRPLLSTLYFIRRTSKFGTLAFSTKMTSTPSKTAKEAARHRLHNLELRARMPATLLNLKPKTYFLKSSHAAF